MLVMKKGYKFDVLTIGPSFVDVFIKITEAELAELGFTRTLTTNVSVAEFDNILAKYVPYAKASGGMATNTAVNISKLGAKVAWIYKLADDELGHATIKEITDAGIYYNTPFAKSDEKTGSCIIFSLPDGDRTMCPYYGAQKEFGPDDIDEQLIANSALVYVAGAAAVDRSTETAIVKAFRLARKHNTVTAFNLFDVNAVNAYRDFYKYLFDEGLVDLCFGTHFEFMAYCKKSNVDDLFADLKTKPLISVVTRGPDGATVIADGKEYCSPAWDAKRVDVTGAGDSFVSGYLYAMSKGKDITECAKKGNQVAGAVIEIVGARPNITDELRKFD